MGNKSSYYYENFEDFYKSDRVSAEQLCRLLGCTIDGVLKRPRTERVSIKWADNEIEVYPNMRTFALDYLVYGVSYGLMIHGDYGKSIPPVDDFIDTNAYGYKLLEEIGTNYAQVLPNGKIVTTSYRW